MKNSIFTLIFTLFVSSLFAQITAVYQHTDFSYATSSGVSVPSLAYRESLVFGKSKIFRVGTGLRLSSFAVNNKKFENGNRFITIQEKYQATTLNIPVHAEIHIKKVFVGANVDVIGIAFSKKRSVDGSITNFGTLDTLTIKPVGFSSVFGKSGTVNSQVYVGVSISPEFAIRLGLSFVNSQFSTNYYNMKEKGYIDADKFCYQTQAMPFISLVFSTEK